MTTPEHAFQQLAAVFASRGSKILEIEIIPSSLGVPFMQDGNFIGVTKKALVQAYTVARHIFCSRLVSMSQDDLRASLVTPTAEPDGVSDLVVTEIMLLFDCEHLTACNWRKRRLLAAMTHSSNAADQIQTELTLMESFQRSPLHRHTKSPTLWSHRLWVWKQWLQRRDWRAEALLQLERDELGLVLRAAELHPKNYYAFSYLRYLHSCLAGRHPEAQDSPTWTVQLAQALVDPVLDWCLANPRDISGWIFEQYLLTHIPERQTRAHAIERVVRFARDVGWEGESLWTFVDQSARQFQLENVLDDILPTQNTTDVVSPEAGQHKPKWPWLLPLARAQAHWAVYDPQGRQ
ncbi:hypothetical protein N7492_002908 [Penicillium capsulatum]|uniref:Protein prenyltransferase n=1 Tax=Penicillium capsulatum TaxID=69766 RepID=A0A9W9IIF0_9EURO|nr:hypothetical protein N7492_002908 [Penicillium capsulatum]KAJ6122498.1 hypothetical protein N7512_004963 [Penicillium capsulatum]